MSQIQSFGTGGVVPPTSMPYFLASMQNAVANATGDNTNYTVLYDTTFQDSAGGYNPLTGGYTIPATGIWVIGFTIQAFGFTGQTDLFSFIASTGTPYRWYAMICNPTNCMGTATTTLNIPGQLTSSFNLGDVITTQLQVNGASGTVAIQGALGAGGDQCTYFYGYQIA